MDNEEERPGNAPDREVLAVAGDCRLRVLVTAWPLVRMLHRVSAGERPVVAPGVCMCRAGYCHGCL